MGKTSIMDLQVEQLTDGTFVVHNLYVRNMLEQVGLCSGKSTRSLVYTSLKMAKEKTCLPLVTPKSTHLEALGRII